MDRQLLLEQVADVRTGITLRGKGAARQSAKEGLPLLRISDVTDAGEIRMESPQLINPTERALRDFRVGSGDVVVANRGSRLTAAVVPPEIEAIAAGQFFIVKPKEANLLPEYLVWFLNQPQVQERLKAECRGSYVSTMPIAALRKLKLILPSLETQKRFVELWELGRRERALVDEISQLRQKYLDAVIHSVASESLT